MKKYVLGSLLMFSLSAPVIAQTVLGNCSQDVKDAIDAEFGIATWNDITVSSSEVTRCLENTGGKKAEEDTTNKRPVRVVYQINQKCKDSTCGAPYAVGNIGNAIKDYENTHGMVRGVDYEIVAIVHSAGWTQVVKNQASVTDPTTNEEIVVTNNFQTAVEGLLAKGVKVYFCQNTARKKGVQLEDMIEGVEFTTSGVTALADFQLGGYVLVQP